MDPTQEGGTEQVIATVNPRNAAMAQIAQRLTEQKSEEFSNFDEAAGTIEAKEPVQQTTEQEPAQVQETAQEVAQEPSKQEPQKRLVQIVVDGQSIEVDEDKIIEAGKRTLQKESAADRRLQEATRLKQQAEALMNQARATREPEPSQDAPSTQQAIPDVGTLKQEIASSIRVELWNDQAKSAADRFTKEYADIAGDPILMGIAADMENKRLAHATAVGEPLGDPYEAYRKHGESIREWLKQRSPKPAEAQDKTELKRTITAIPAVNAKAPAPQEQKPKTVSEEIEEMRKLRAQGYRTQGFQRLKA